MRYESEVLYDLMKRDGLLNPSQDNLPYESELKEKYVDEVKGAYPKLIDYRAEWLNYAYENPIGEFPYETLTNVTEATIDNVVPYAYKSAILKGSTKYHDIDTGEFLETFEEGRNLELVSVRMPVLTTTGKNLFDINQTVDGYFGSDGNISQPDFNNKVSNYIKVKPNTVYIYSFDGFSNSDVGGIYWTGWFYYNSQKEIIGSRQVNSGGNESNKKITFTTPSDCNYIRIGSRGLGLNDVAVQLELGSVATSYEPYKTNILTVNEDVTLRSNGSVCDELDLLTGKLTQRIDEDGEILTQEVVNTVDLTSINQDGVQSTFRPLEGTMHIRTDGNPLKPLLDMEVPVEAITQNIASFIE